jgi:hypothetical protein
MMAIGVVGIFLLKIAAVGKENPAEIAGRRGGIDFPGESVPDQQREIAAVVEVGCVRMTESIPAGSNGSASQFRRRSCLNP